jgi:lysophospholipase L1-like esterase
VARSPVDIVIVGDSLSAGEFASDRPLTCSALILQGLSRAAEQAPSCRVVAVPGARVVDLLRRRPPAAHRVAVIEAGTNDWLGYRPVPPWRETPIAELRDAYARLLRHMTRDARPSLVCLGIWSPPESGDAGARRRREAYDDAIALECARFGGRFVGLTPIADDPSARGPEGRRTPFGVADAVHANDRGHALIATAVLAALAAAA